MSNRIIAALEKVTEKLGTTLGEDGKDAVEKLYRITGKNTEEIAERVGKVDAEHEGDILKILKKMDENAGKSPGTSLERAQLEKERANLREQLARKLNPDAAKAAQQDFTRAKNDLAYEEELARRKAAGSGATALGQDNAGRPTSMYAKGGEQIDVSGLPKDEQIATLKSATAKLGDDTLTDKNLQGGKRQPGTSTGFLHDGQVSVHTSMKGHSDIEPNTHPALQSVLDEMEATTPRDLLGTGHGNCGEIATVSDELWRLDPEGTNISSLDDLRAALKNADGSNASIYSTHIGDDKVNGAFSHGDYFPACATCNPLMAKLEVDVVP